MCGATLVFIRFLSPYFVSGTVTADHPVFALVAALFIGSLAWLFMVRSLGDVDAQARASIWFYGLILIGLIVRFCFWDSVPIYEDDWRRYLWDGALIANGMDPYLYTPERVHAAAQPGSASVPDLAQRAILSRDAGHFAGTINNPDLTTIYPPMAQFCFALAYMIDPFAPDGLRTVFLLAEGLGLWMMTKALVQSGRGQLWAMAYWLNPVLIFVTYSGLHMDVLLVAPLMFALYYALSRPFLSGTALVMAVAIKIWPLLLAPILFRHLRRSLPRIGALAIWIGGLSAIALIPLISHTGSDSGLGAYSTGWTNSSFVFPLLRSGLDVMTLNGDALARLTVAGLLIGLSLWFGLCSDLGEDNGRSSAPFHLLLLSAALLWLSPTGYPWYLIWVLMFIPFVPRFWALALFPGAAAYYLRFWLGEAGHYLIYSLILVPLWYGVPLILFLGRFVHVRRSV